MILTVSLFLMCVTVQQFFGDYAAAASYVAMSLIVLARTIFEFKKINRRINHEK